MAVCMAGRGHADRRPSQRDSMGVASTAGTVGGATRGVRGIASDGKNRFVTMATSLAPMEIGTAATVDRFEPGPISSGLPSHLSGAPEPGNCLIKATRMGAAQVRHWWTRPPQRLPIPSSRWAIRHAHPGHRDNLGGIGAPLASGRVASSTILQAAVTIEPNKAPMSCSVRNNDGNTVLNAGRITDESAYHRHRRRGM